MTARYVAPRSCCFLKASDKTMYKNVNLLVDRAFQNHVLVAWEALSCGFFGRVVQHRYGIATGAARREEFWQWQPRSSTFKMSMSSLWSTKWTHFKIFWWSLPYQLSLHIAISTICGGLAWSSQWYTPSWLPSTCTRSWTRSSFIGDWRMIDSNLYYYIYI
jgi:hypothetical protein